MLKKAKARDRYAVFGSPIKHSKSPHIHQLFAEQTKQDLDYSAKEVNTERFKETVTQFFAEGGKGLNCTLPLKQLAWAFADFTSKRADVSRAVNTLILQDDDRILGENTDGIGLIKDLTVNHGVVLQGSRILVLGAGGACRGILAPILEKKPRELALVNRTKQKATDLAAEFSVLGEIDGYGYPDINGMQFDLIINATSASLSDDLPPLPDDILTLGGTCYDLAYGRRPTSFVLWGQQNEASKSLDGLGMLVEQAAESFFLWRGIKPQTAPVIAALNASRNQKKGEKKHTSS